MKKYISCFMIVTILFSVCFRNVVFSDSSKNVVSSNTETYFDYEIINLNECEIENASVSEDGNIESQVSVKSQEQEYILNIKGCIYDFGENEIDMYNKNVVLIEQSNYNILNYTICEANDFYSDDIIVQEGEVLVLVAFVDEKDKTIYSVKKVIEILENEDVQEIINVAQPANELDFSIKCNLKSMQTWETKCYEENFGDNGETASENLSISTNDSTEIENEIVNTIKIVEYQQYGEINVIETVNNVAATYSTKSCSGVDKDGDGGFLIDYILPKSIFLNPGCYKATVNDTSTGNAAYLYHAGTAYYGGKLRTLGTAWGVIGSQTGTGTSRRLEYSILRKYNFAATYDHEEKIIYITLKKGDCETTNRQLKIGTYGLNNPSYFTHVKFGYRKGDESFSDVFIGHGISGIVGHMVKDSHALIQLGVSLIELSVDLVEVATKEKWYEINSGNNYTKVVATTHTGSITEEYAECCILGLLDNVKELSTDARIIFEYSAITYCYQGGSYDYHGISYNMDYDLN